MLVLRSVVFLPKREIILYFWSETYITLQFLDCDPLERRLKQLDCNLSCVLRVIVNPAAFS